MPDGLFSAIYLNKGSFILEGAEGAHMVKAPQLMFAVFTEAQKVIPQEEVEVYGATYHPYFSLMIGAGQPREFLNQFWDASEVLPAHLLAPLHRLHAADDGHRIVDVLGKLVRGLVLQNEVTQSKAVLASRILISGGGKLRVSELAKTLGFSERTLQYDFKQTFGLTIKQFANICRFNLAKYLLDANSHAGLMEIAVASGYYDTPHLVRDFKSFSGFAPMQYAAADVGMGSLFGLRPGSLQLASDYKA